MRCSTEALRLAPLPNFIPCEEFAYRYKRERNGFVFNVWTIERRSCVVIPSYEKGENVSVKQYGIHSEATLTPAPICNIDKIIDVFILWPSAR